MPTRSQSASTSLRMCDDRNTVWPRCGPRARVSRKATSISGSRPLVGSSSMQQVGAAGERRDELHLLAVALRQRAHLLGGVELEALDQRVAVGDVGAAAHAGEELERLGAGQRRPQVRLAGHVGDAAVGGHGIAPGIDAEELRAARASAGAARAGAGSSSSCRRRWDRDSRTPRPASRRGRGSRGRASRRSAWSVARCGSRLP